MPVCPVWPSDRPAVYRWTWARPHARLRPLPLPWPWPLSAMATASAIAIAMGRRGPSPILSGHSVGCGLPRRERAQECACGWAHGALADGLPPPEEQQTTLPPLPPPRSSPVTIAYHTFHLPGGCWVCDPACDLRPSATGFAAARGNVTGTHTSRQRWLDVSLPPPWSPQPACVQTLHCCTVVGQTRTRSVADPICPHTPTSPPARQPASPSVHQSTCAAAHLCSIRASCLIDHSLSAQRPGAEVPVCPRCTYPRRCTFCCPSAQAHRQPRGEHARVPLQTGLPIAAAPTLAAATGPVASAAAATAAVGAATAAFSQISHVGQNRKEKQKFPTTGARLRTPLPTSPHIHHHPRPSLPPRAGRAVHFLDTSMSRCVVRGTRCAMHSAQCAGQFAGARSRCVQPSPPASLPAIMHGKHAGLPTTAPIHHSPQFHSRAPIPEPS